MRRGEERSEERRGEGRRGGGRGGVRRGGRRGRVRRGEGRSEERRQEERSEERREEEVRVHACILVEFQNQVGKLSHEAIRLVHPELGRLEIELRSGRAENWTWLWVNWRECVSHCESEYSGSLPSTPNTTFRRR